MNPAKMMWCTERANREGAELAYAHAYAALGVRLAPKVIWFESPAAAARFVARGDSPMMRRSTGVVEPLMTGYISRRLELSLDVRIPPRSFKTLTLCQAWLQELNFLSSGIWEAVHGYEQLRSEIARRFIYQHSDPAGLAGHDQTGTLGIRPMFGQHDADIAFIAAAAISQGIKVPQLSKAALQAANDGGMWWPLEGMVVATERPSEVHLLDGRLHRDGGPAICWSDGTRCHFWKGMAVEHWLVDTPISELTPSLVDGMTNAEYRRVLIERMGYERYMRLGDSTLVHEDACGRLWQRQSGFDELMVVEVTNTTPEPNGIFKRYWIRVPPSVKTAREAVAWTFSMSAYEYRPVSQS